MTLPYCLSSACRQHASRSRLRVSVWGFALILAASFAPEGVALAADPAPPPATPPPVKCEIAMVSPVSGNAECVQPYGAPVDPPPPRPRPSKEVCDKYRSMGIETGQECETPKDAAHPP